MLGAVAFIFLCLSLNAEQLFGQQFTYQKEKDGLTLLKKNERNEVTLRTGIHLVEEGIVHVRSVPISRNSVINPTLNYVVTDTVEKEIPYTLTETENQLTLETKLLTLKISLTDGHIQYDNPQKSSFLTEGIRTDASFLPSMADGDLFYQVEQNFNLSAQTGLYGLGQHQKGVMNYQGRQVNLLQYNTEVAIPFLISTDNWGLLWNNYSITKAGDTRALLPLSALRLKNPEGKAGWINASYLNKNDLKDTLFKQPISDFSYNYLSDMHKFPEEVDLANSIVVYEGSLSSADSGLYRLHFNYAGYLKVYVDGHLVADRWRESWNAGTFETALPISDKEVKIRMEWSPEGSQSYLGIQVQRPLKDSGDATFGFKSEAGDAVDYYLIKDQNMDGVIGGYRRLTGKAKMLPQWAYGYWQSRERYKTETEIREVAKTFRQKNIPVDNLVLDWSYWPEKEWGSQEFDSARFQDPKGMIRDLHQSNYHFMISVWPKFNEEANTFSDFYQKGWLYQRNIADGRKDWIGKGYTSTFYDPFNAEARRGFWDLLKGKLYDKGVDAFWMDASEPDVHSNINIEERKSVFSPQSGSSTRYYNAFPLLNAKGIYEGQMDADPDKRVFLLTRSGFAGQQRYSAAVWSGDIASRWHDMRDQIAAGVNFSMSGLPYWTMDVGGFLVEKRFHQPNEEDLEEWRELNNRWFQFGAFVPLFRAHGQYPFREPYNIAPEEHPAYKSILFQLHLRYRLMPYIYSLAGKVYHEDYSMMRALAMDFPSDPATYAIDNQFMMGSNLLINPVTTYGAKEREVYLPSGTSWYDLYRGEKYDGGQSISAKAPYDRMPVFAKAGTILPIGPQQQYVGEEKAEELLIYVFPGAPGAFTLYEDGGLSNAYENGEHSSIPFRYLPESNRLEIGAREGRFPGMLNKRRFKIVVIRGGVGVDFESTKAPQSSFTVQYTGKKTLVELK